MCVCVDVCVWMCGCMYIYIICIHIYQHLKFRFLIFRGPSLDIITPANVPAPRSTKPSADTVPATVRCTYNAINFITISCIRHAIAPPLRRSIVFLSKIQTLIDILPPSLQWYMQDLVRLDRVITAMDSFELDMSSFKFICVEINLCYLCSSNAVI